VRVFYYISGPAHLPYLVCSIYTLRQFWDGEVVVYAWPESISIVDKIAKDSGLRIGVYLRSDQKQDLELGKLNGKKRQALDRIRVMMEQDCTTLYLDCDTTVHGDVRFLMKLGADCGYCATQWNDWVTTGRLISKRIRGLREIEGIPQKAVGKLLSVPFPSLNCGVVAFRSTSPVLEDWYKWSLAASRIFIPDEVTQHLVMVEKAAYCAVACEDGRWNCSPHLRSSSLEHEDVVIYHYHGSSNCRPDKSHRGCELWLPIYDECLKNNVGRMAEWRGKINNKHLDKVRPYE